MQIESNEDVQRFGGQSGTTTDDLTKIGVCLSDPIAVTILWLLRQGELCTCEIKAALSARGKTMFVSLKRLREANLIRVRRREQWFAFSLRRHYADLVETLFECTQGDVHQSGWEASKVRLQSVLAKRVNGWCPSTRKSRPASAHSPKRSVYT